MLLFCPTWATATAYSLAVHSFSLIDFRKFRMQLHNLSVAHKKKKIKRPCQPILQLLHWLPIKAYKISTLCSNVITGTGPQYLSELLLYTPSRDLCSSTDTCVLKIPRSSSKAFGQRSFSHVAPSTWNDLPCSLRRSDSQTSFRQALKTHLFQQSLQPSTLVSLACFPLCKSLATCS